jgi:hypothetical protein
MANTSSKLKKGGRKGGPRCTVCFHPDRHRIEMARVAGASFDALSAKFGINRHAIWRHCRDHLDESSRASYLADVPLVELAERANAESVSLLDYFGLVRSTLMTQMLVAAGVNDGHRVATLAGKAVIVLREIGRITGEVRAISSSLSVTNVTILNTPIFTDLQAMLLSRLDFPDALGAVVEGLRDLEAQAGAAPLELPPAMTGGEHASAA